MTIVILMKLQQELQFSAIWLSHHNYFDVLFITYLLTSTTLAVVSELGNINCRTILKKQHRQSLTLISYRSLKQSTIIFNYSPKNNRATL